MAGTTKVISYNFNRGGNMSKGNQWKRIFAEFSPELVLAQETLDPASYFEDSPLAGNSTVWSPLPAKWGSAVLAKKKEVTPIVVPGFEGWVFGARIDGFVDGRGPVPLSIFSIHNF